MRVNKWISVALIALCLLVLLIYICVDRLVTDSTPPTITMEAVPPQIRVGDPKTALLQGVTAKDDKSGDVTDSLMVESVRLTDPDGTITVTYAAFDEAGNVTKARRELRYIDYVSPRFTLTAPLVMELNRYSDLQSRIQLLDAVDGDISGKIHVDNLTGSSVAAVGTYDVKLWATNSLGDTVQLKLPVEIYAAGAYSGTLELTDYLIYLPVGADFRPEQYLKSYDQGGSAVDLAAGTPEDCSLQITGQVDTQTPGVYEVRFQISRSVGNRVYTGYTKLMVVVEG